MLSTISRTPRSFFQDVPCYLPELPADPYSDTPELDEYVARYQGHLDRETICDGRLFRRDTPGTFLSIGEGTGEFICAMATRYPQHRFYAFDYTPARARIARSLVEHLGLSNVEVFIASASDIPLPNNSVDGVIERGVFHVLPRAVKEQNILEIERVCRGNVVMPWMANGHIYLVRRFWQTVRTGNPVYLRNAWATYQTIEPGCRSLRKMAQLIESISGHSVEVIYNYRGDVETTCERNNPVWLQWLGSLAYATDR